MTWALVRKYRTLVIEDLNVRGMMAGLTPKAQADAGMGEVRRQLIYKGLWHHCAVMLANRYYPSSKTCSRDTKPDHEHRTRDSVEPES